MYKEDRELIVGFTCSAFDLLHAGHILMLEEARDQCDYLIVGLQNDPSLDRKEKNRPIQSLVERYVQLKAVAFVDEIIVYNTEKDLTDLLKILPIDIRIVGEEYKDKQLTGRDVCESRNIQIYYNKRNHTFSTTELRKRVQAAENGVTFTATNGSLGTVVGYVANTTPYGFTSTK
jgi:glycerol-3-phosphate cytidylyltransferase